MIALHTLFASVASLLLIGAWSGAYVGGRSAPETMRSTQESLPQTTAEALAGEWIYFEDRSPEVPPERQRPNQGARFTLRIDGNAVVMESPRGSRTHETRIPLDGSTHEQRSGDTTSLFIGRWEGGALSASIRVDAPGQGKREVTVSRLTLTPTGEGLLARLKIEEPIQVDSLCLYKRAADIALPAPAKAELAAVTWIGGDWTGTMGAMAIEERWSPPAGGAMLATARTVSKGRMVAFEFLRIVERDGGLVYIAQPNGSPPTEFVLTEASEGRAVFENPRHDFPQRIVYERADENGLRASIGYCRGGRPTQYAFQREVR
jgi:hypothetical protein